MTKASISAVKPEPGSAHGTCTCLTPCSLHCTRLTSAIRIVWNWQVSRWRQPDAGAADSKPLRQPTRRNLRAVRSSALHAPKSRFTHTDI